MKTPEQMAEDILQGVGKVASELWGDDEQAKKFAETIRSTWLAGYQAAKDRILQLEKLLKEANDTVAGMADECEGLKTIIYDHDETNLLTSANWISVKERLPEDGDDLSIMLVWRNIEHDYDTVRWRYQQGWDCVIQDKSTITHWMPLPEAPKEEG